MITMKPIGKPFIHDLVSITFETTYLCDKKCSYCYNPIPRFQGASEEAKDKVWNQIMSIKTPLQVLMLGGETTFYEKSIDYFNEFSTKYMNDTTKHMVFFTHGNNKPEVYQRFVGGKKHSTVSFSYHGDQTDLDLWFSNMKILLNNNVRVVTCLLVTENTDWEETRQILQKVKSLGADTQVDIEIQGNDQIYNEEAMAYFDEYLYKCFKITELEFRGSDNLNIPRDDYFQYFPKGLSANKVCYNKVYRITPNLDLEFECGVGNKHSLLEHDLECLIRTHGTMCKQQCTGIASTLNTKQIFATNVKEI